MGMETMNTQSCKYLDEGQCLVIYQLCGASIYPREEGEESSSTESSSSLSSSAESSSSSSASLDNFALITSKQQPQLSCSKCIKYSPPQEINDYTKCIASEILVQKNLPPLYTGNGPGTRLKNLLYWFVDAPPGCDCASRAAIMDAWGVVGCRHNKNQIIHWLYESAQLKGIRVTKTSISALVESVLFVSTLLDYQQKVKA
jgi:hypothetical protein